MLRKWRQQGSASDFISSAVMVYPKNMISLAPNSHFAGFIATAYSSKRLNEFSRCVDGAVLHLPKLSESRRHTRKRNLNRV